MIPPETEWRGPAAEAQRTARPDHGEEGASHGRVRICANKVVAGVRFSTRLLNFRP
jgi:hypothetical protein